MYKTDITDKWAMLGVGIDIAAFGHVGQFDKGGRPYILHPLFLMNKLLYDAELATIAVLHDVIEDTVYTLDVLEGLGFNERILTALTLLTHEKGVSYDEYIEGICTNLDAITVKRKDIDHNTRVLRLKGLEEKDFARLEKYFKAYARLGEAKRNLKKT